jgi:hypothetical protein
MRLSREAYFKPLPERSHYAENTRKDLGFPRAICKSLCCKDLIFPISAGSSRKDAVRFSAHSDQFPAASAGFPRVFRCVPVVF